MALPVIKINSSTGSDTQASGAGPTTALFGGTGVTSVTGLVVDLIADAPDLSGVATDGSAVIFMSDTNAGSRNFGKITAVDNTLKTVTVSDAFQASNTDAWAIGGKRASLFSTTSRKLAENNGAAGDAMPGWIIELETNESPSASLTWRRAGDTTSGPVKVRGALAGSRPVLTQTANVAHFGFTVTGLVFEHLEFQNSNGTKTAAAAFSTVTSSLFTIIKDCVFGDATNRLLHAFIGTSNSSFLLMIDCEVKQTSSHCINIIGPTTIINCSLHHAQGSGVGINCQSGTNSLNVKDSQIWLNAGAGIATTGAAFGINVVHSTIDDNGGNGITISALIPSNYSYIYGNNITSNGGYGIAGPAAAALLEFFSDYNNFGTGGSANTSGAYQNFNTGAHDLTVDPGYTDAANGDFGVGTSVRAKGYPDSTRHVGGNPAAGSTSYVDIGVAQRQEPSSGGGLARIIGG